MLYFEIPKASNCERFRNEGTDLLHRSRLGMTIRRESGGR